MFNYGDLYPAHPFTTSGMTIPERSEQNLLEVTDEQVSPVVTSQQKRGTWLGILAILLVIFVLGR